MVRMPLDLGLLLTVLILCGALIAVQLVILTFEVVKARRDMLRAIAFFAAASGAGWRGRPIVDEVEWGEWGDEEPTEPQRPARVMQAVAAEGRLSSAWVRLCAFVRRCVAALRGRIH